MAAGSSKKAVYAAIAGNSAIAVTKFIAGAATGSSAMIAEGVHSVVDTGNGMLILFGIRASQKPASELHPFGHGKELYFWTLIVAILIFAVGGGVSMYEGVRHLRHPTPISDPTWNYVVLGLAMIFEGFAWYVAYKQFGLERGKQPLLRAIRRSKDPTVFTVLFEDSAAMLGLIVAAIGITFAYYFDLPWMDGAASVLIGLILAGVAVFLAYESKGLLVGEGANPRTIESIRRIAGEDPAVARVVRSLTMHFGPQEVLLTLELQFRQALSSPEVTAAIERVDRAIRTAHPEIEHVFIEAQSIPDPHRNEGAADST